MFKTMTTTMILLALMVGACAGPPEKKSDPTLLADAQRWRDRDDQLLADARADAWRARHDARQEDSREREHRYRMNEWRRQMEMVRLAREFSE